MARPPVLPAEEKARIVLSILAGEITVAEAARRVKVSEQSIGTWKRQFLEAGRAGLAPGRHYYYQEVAGGEHNEANWAARFDKVLLYFFGQ